MAAIVSSGLPLSRSSFSARQSVIVDWGAETISAIDSGRTVSDNGAAQLTQVAVCASLAATIARHHHA